MAKRRKPSVDECLKLMRSRDAMTAEEGFHLLLCDVSAHAERLMAEFETETRRDMRCWLLELIGEARSERALDLFIREARLRDESLLPWALRGLEKLNTPAARQALYDLSKREP
jgi:hypothetical protein